MDTQPEPEAPGTGSTPPAKPRRPGQRLLTGAVLLLLAAAGLLWAAGAVTWADQRYRTPFSGERTAAVTGGMLRPELVPLALATLAAIAAVLATGGWMRRLVGLLVVLEGALLVWRLFGWMAGPSPVPPIPGAPPGSEPVAQTVSNPLGPALMAAGAVALLVTGVLVLVGARRMPAMGAKYSAPASARRDTRDPDRRLWDALDEGHDPTDPRGGSGAGA